MSSYFMCMKDMIIMKNIEELKRFFMKMNFRLMWSLDDPWGLIKYNFCSYPAGMIVIKFDRNPIKCVEEEKDCQTKNIENKISFKS